jgi:DNA-binding transcriptional regulator YdaS (Cro superfamily)
MSRDRKRLLLEVIATCYQGTIMENRNSQKSTIRSKPPKPSISLAEEISDETEIVSATDGIFDSRLSNRGPFARGVEPNRGVLEAIKRAGSQRALAEQMQVKQSTIHGWLWENISAERTIELEQKTSVSRRITRPDLFAVESPLVHSKPPIDKVHRERYPAKEDD